MPSVTWDLSIEAWSSFLARCPQATFFHSPQWYRAHARAMGYQPHNVLIRFEDGAEAFLPFALRRSYRGLVTEAWAGIENGYGGLVSPTPLTPGQVETAYNLMRRRFPDLVVVGNPYERYINVPPGAPRQDDETQVLAIVDPEAQRKLMAETRGKQVKRAAGAGFRVEVIHKPTEADAARFYPLYAERAADWAYTKWVRDESYFRALLAEAGDQLVLFLGYHEDRLAGFRLLGLYGPVVMDLFLATSRDFEKLYVGPHLVAEPLAWCHEQGYELFDFQPSGRLEGVKAYKGSFGATSRPHFTTRQGGMVGRTLSTMRALVQRARPGAAKAS